MYYQKIKQNRGIALVAILAVLTVLGIMASVFVIQMRMESKTAETFLLRSRTDMLMLAAIEHAKAEIFNDSALMPGFDSTSEPWNSDFTTTSKDPRKSINIRGESGINGEPENNSRWFYIRDKTGSIIGRYAVSIEDEAGKINVNAASSLNSKTQNQGIGTAEIIISDGKKRGIPIGIKSAKKIIAYRYGRDKAPGQAKSDDNTNNVSLMYDGVDNNGNGVIDESDDRAAIDRYFSETLQVAGHFLEFFNHFLVALAEKHLDLQLEEIEIPDPPSVGDIYVPYFVSQ